MRKMLTILTLLMLVAAPAAADDRGEEPSQPGKHRYLGMTLGLVGGFIFGGWAAAEICDDCESPAGFVAMWAAFATAGAVGGYAAAGGFSHERVDLALERGREAVRAAQARATLPELRLAAIPGFADVELAAASPELELASLRSLGAASMR